MANHEEKIKKQQYATQILTCFLAPKELPASGPSLEPQFQAAEDTETESLPQAPKALPNKLLFVQKVKYFHYQEIRKEKATRVTGVTEACKRQQTAVRVFDQEVQSPAGTDKDSKTQGWALESMKKPSRMIDKTKTYLVNIFEQGNQIGHKADPIQVSRQTELDKDVDDMLPFKPDEWRTPPPPPNRLVSCSPV